MSTTPDKAIAEMKCWAIPMLVLSILSGNLAIFICGIIGSSMVVCCSSTNQQVAKNACCFKGCAIACAVLAGLHTVGALALGAVFISTSDECREHMTEHSCNHLDGRRLEVASPGSLGVAAALNKVAAHAPLLLGIVTGGSGLLVPNFSLGAALAKPAPGAHAGPLAPNTSSSQLPRRLESEPVRNSCRDWGEDCCWGGWESEEALACDSGYRPELTDSDCFFGLGQEYECEPDSAYTTKEACETHMESICQDQFIGAIIFFFFWMAWEIIGCIIYAVAACKAAIVPADYQDPAQAGTQMQPVAVATPVAQPAVAMAIAQPAVATAVA